MKNTKIYAGVVRLLVVLFVAWPLSLARGEVVRVEVRSRGPFAAGHAFGRSGAYEKIVGRLYLEVDPLSSTNQPITDLKLAKRNARGRVEFWSDFFLLKPLELNRGNGRLLFDVNNRGNKLALWTFNEVGGNNPSTLADAGNGFLMEQGFSLLSCGWNGDVMPGGDRMLAGLPVVQQADGRPLTGPMHVEICRDERVFSTPFYWTPWGYSASYLPADPDPRKARLTMRPRREEPAVEIPPSEWAFGRWEQERFVPDPMHLYVKAGFRPGWLYELVYVARDPRVTGLGLATVRDCVSFFRYDAGQRAEAPNPLAGGIARSYALGISQTGRFLNTFLYHDFNGDERGRMVFDGLLIHVPGSGRGQFNKRFGMTTLCGTAHEGQLSASESFPFTTVEETDPLTGQKGDILARSRRAGHLPKIFYTQSSTEYWTRGASLLHTDPEGRRDVALDPKARLYIVAGAQHLGGSTTDRRAYQNLCNPLNDRPPVLRALLIALDRWASTGQQPPASRYPRIADGTLVDLATFRGMFPRLPQAHLPMNVYAPCRLDFGPRWESEGIADCVPPRVGAPYRMLVPAVDTDGNERAGIRLPEVAVPRATYTGWNLRAPAFGAAGLLAPYHGSYFPFPATLEERTRTADPRRSLAERYPNRAAYVSKYNAAALALQAEGLLLERDVAELVRKAETAP
jgi:hypothetical protein